MACEPYNDWLMDAALGALPSWNEAELQRHLAVCSVCRSALEQERLLLGAIDCGVAACVAAEPAPEMVARVRMRLAEETALVGNAFRLWLPIAAAALALVVLLGLWFRPRVPSAPRVAGKTASATPWRAVPSGPHNEAPPARELSLHHTVVPPRKAAPQEPEVLVPPGQWQAVLELADAVNHGRLDGPALAAELENFGKPIALEAMSPAPLEIARLDEERKLAEDNNER